MPLSKQAKALYEAALRRKGLPLDKATVKHARDFIGPRQTIRDEVANGFDVPHKMYPDDYVISEKVPRRYFDGRGRNQDLYDELWAADKAVRYTTPGMASYQELVMNPRLNGRGKKYLDRMTDAETIGRDYDDPSAYVYRRRDTYPGLTALGDAELEAQFEADLIEGYKKYLRGMYSGKIPPRPRTYDVQYYNYPEDHWDYRSYTDLDEALSEMRELRNRGMGRVELFEK